MTLSLIAALAGSRRVIGKGGDMPWHYPADLRFFKETTLGHTLLMGRTTYESILKRLGKPLPGRTTLVLSRDPAFIDSRVTIIRNLSEIQDYRASPKELMVVGGAKIYEQTIGLAQKLYLTHIDREIDGDAFFPPYDKADWTCVDERHIEDRGSTLRFVRYEHKNL